MTDPRKKTREWGSIEKASREMRRIKQRHNAPKSQGCALLILAGVGVVMIMAGTVMLIMGSTV
jgi:hypothetical protein